MNRWWAGREGPAQSGWLGVVDTRSQPVASRRLNTGWLTGCYSWLATRQIGLGLVQFMNIAEHKIPKDSTRMSCKRCQSNVLVVLTAHTLMLVHTKHSTSTVVFQVNPVSQMPPWLSSFSYSRRKPDSLPVTQSTLSKHCRPKHYRDNAALSTYCNLVIFGWWQCEKQVEFLLQILILWTYALEINKAKTCYS